MIRHRLTCAVTPVAVLGLTAATHAVVIGDWEQTDDGWIDWGTQATITAPKYTYSTTGATRGDYALQLTQNDWNQNLSIKLQDNGLVDAFLANTAFTIDVTVEGSQTEGWQEIYTLYINAEGYSFQSQPPIPKVQFGFPNGEAQTTTVTWDYSSVLPQLPDNPGWVELIIATNNDSVHNTFYFDNAQLVPEPAGLALLTLGGALALTRRRTA